VNCFDWQNRASDYLDGTLIGAIKREADEHLEGCDTCGSRHKHYRLILSSIANQPRTSLPLAIRKAPFNAQLAKAPGPKTGLLSKLKGWANVPWYIRVPFEGLSIILIVTLGISVGPRLRYLYERKVERSLNEYSEGFESTESDAGNGSGANSNGQAQATLTSGSADSASAKLLSTDVSGSNGGGGGNGGGGNAAAAQTAANAANEDAAAPAGTAQDDEGEGDDEADAAEIHVGKAEVWRFNLKTDSPRDVRPKIVALLTSLAIPDTTPGMAGIEAPGGIQFDILVTPDVVPQVKQALEKMAPPPPKDLVDSPFGETFTWYKNKSKTPIPPGKTRLVIWLSQI
jgi:hypothetical protein